jgi:hypothetical protein
MQACPCASRELHAAVGAAGQRMKGSVLAECSRATSCRASREQLAAHDHAASHASSVLLSRHSLQLPEALLQLAPLTACPRKLPVRRWSRRIIMSSQSSTEWRCGCGAATGRTQQGSVSMRLADGALLANGQARLPARPCDTPAVGAESETACSRHSCACQGCGRHARPASCAAPPAMRLPGAPA